MRYFIVYALLGLLCLSCNSGGRGYKLIVKGVGFADIEVVMLSMPDHTNRKPEETLPVSKGDNMVVFEGLLKAPCTAKLKVGENVTGDFVLSNTKIKIRLNPETADFIAVDGGYQQEMKNEYDRLLKVEEKNIIYNQLRGLERGSEKYNNLLDQLAPLTENDQILQIGFIEEHPDAMMAPYALWRIYSAIGENEAIRLFNLIDTALNKQAQYLFIEKTIRAWERTSVGSEVPNLSQVTPDGKTITLHDFKGNYLLIDFWASWCTPCRAANPHMVELYKNYHEKGIEFLGVSLDKSEDDWIQAIESDGLAWPQVSDLNYWDNKISRYFGINSIPATMIIDPEGKIIAKKLRGDELDRKLVETFNN